VVWLVVGIAGAIPARALAADDPWSVGVFAGYFAPAVEGWENNYDRRGGWVPDLSIGYAASRWVSVVAEAAYFSASSFARGAITGDPSIEQERLTLVLTTVGGESRLRLSPTQMLVPFVGAGYRRVSYRLKVGSDTATGGAHGWVGRGGIDVLLNQLDPSAASGLREDYGVARSYVRLEAQWAKVEAPGTAGSDIDLGGTTVLAGLRFEF
jgi:hypothetical protein